MGLNLLKDKITESVLIAQKTCFKGAMFGHISNGGGLIKLSDDYAIRFIADNEKFITLELYRYAINATAKNQSWQKSKVIKVKKKEDEIKFQMEDKKEELF